VSCWIKSERKLRKRGRSKAERKIKWGNRGNSLKRARQAHFYTADGKLRVNDPQVEHQSRCQPAHQVKFEEQKAARHSREDLDAASSLINLSCHSHEKLDAALSLIDFSRKAWVSHDPAFHRPNAATAPRTLTELDVRAALTLVKLSREDETHFLTTDRQLRVEPQAEHQSHRPIHHHLGTEAQEALRCSSKKWDAALSLIDFSRKAWVHNPPNAHTPDAAAATRCLSQLQHEDAELARHLTVEDARAASTLVKLSRESARQESVAALKGPPNNRDVDNDVTMSDGLDHERRGFSSMDHEGWVIDGVRGLGA
jgi:hypothetical protein